MNELKFDSIEEWFDFMRGHLESSYTMIAETTKKIKENEEIPFAVVADVINFCSTTFTTLDAILQIVEGMNNYLITKIQDERK